jgi:hypothetical protein
LAPEAGAVDARGGGPAIPRSAWNPSPDGGGTGYASAPMLPDVRSYFQANGGVASIPTDRAERGVSAVGSYQAVG